MTDLQVKPQPEPQTVPTATNSMLIAITLVFCSCSLTGVAGELDNLDNVNEQQCLDCIAKHLDKIVGVKIRLTAQIADSGKNEHEAFRYIIDYNIFLSIIYGYILLMIILLLLFLTFMAGPVTDTSMKFKS